MKRLLLSILLVCAGLFSPKAQTVFTSVGDGSFVTTGTSVWSPSATASDFTDGLNTFIVSDGQSIIIDGGSTINVASIEVGAGTSGILTFGNSTTSAEVTVLNDFVVQNGGTFQVNTDDGNSHDLQINGDIVNNGGSFTLESGTGLVNTTLGGSTTAVLSGSTMTFNDLSINGGGSAIILSTIDVNGNFLADGSGTKVNTTSNLNFAGDFTISNSAIFTATYSTLRFDGLTAQNITFTTGEATFNSITFDNSNKTVTGNLITDGTFEITDDAIWTNTGNDHQIANLEVKNNSGISLNGGSVTFLGGEIRFGDDTGTDGTITLGTGTNIIIQGTEYIEPGDNLTIDGDMEIIETGQFVIGGSAGGAEDSNLNVSAGHTLTLLENADIYLRGYDNFPTTFDTYNFDQTSLVRYDRDYLQIIRGENYLGNTITLGRLYISQSDASTQVTKQLNNTENLILSGQFDLVNGSRFYASHSCTINFGEDLYMDPGTGAGDPVFDAQEAVVTLDANFNQVVDGPLSGSYDVESWIITNSSSPTAIKIVYIDNNISIDGSFSITNPNGSPSNLLVVDIDDFQIIGELSNSDNFTLGAYCRIQTSSNDADGFAEGFGDTAPADVISIDPESIIRFDRNGDQAIPNFNGGTFGSIEFSGSGNKYIPFEQVGFDFFGVDLNIEGDVSRIGGSPVFRFGSIGDAFQRDVNHTVSGDWNMDTRYTGDDETNGGIVDAIITFDGANQTISASDFGSVVFAGSGTKTLTGQLLIDANLTINDGVTVNAGSEAIDILGNWTENGTGTFTQTGSTTDFIGGTTQNIVTTSNSYFNYLIIDNNSSVDINSSVNINGDLDIRTGSIDIEGETLIIGRDLWVRSGTSINYSNATSTIIRFDGATEQDIRNIEASQNFPTLEFEGVGNKEIVNNIMTIEGDLTISNESTFNGNGFQINFEGDNWTNNGNFNHTNSVNFVNNGGTTTVSTSTFHDIDIGQGDGTLSTTVLLAGNISLDGEMNIFANSTLDVSASNYAITVEEDWNNYGSFVAQNGTVTFIGNESDFRSVSNSLANSGSQADKAFFNLVIGQNTDARFDIEDDGLGFALNDQFDILNDLTITSGYFRYRITPSVGTVNIGGSLINSGNGLEFRNDQDRIVMNGSSGTHEINLGGDQVRNFQINASGATYQLTGDFNTRDDSDNSFDMIDGTLDLNGNILTINRGGVDMTGGTLIIDEGASMLINDIGADPNFDKSGGTLQIIGIDGTPATLSAVDAGGFNFTQSGGDIQAQYYTIANTTTDGLRIEGGTIDGTSTGNDFSNGTFTSGAGTAYLTLANIPIGTISANNVIFNAGPSNNVAVDLANQPVSGSIEFIISGGSLAGAQDELDNPDGGATTGFIRWDEDPGFTWVGGTSSAWNVAANWIDTSGDADGIPDSDDIIYIEAGAPNDPIIGAGENYSVARITIRNSGNLSLTGDGSLSVDGNFTIFSGSTLDMSSSSTSTLFIAGSWSNAGTFNEGTATVTFNGTTGTHPITTLGNGDPFYNIVIDGSGATYTLGSVLTITNSYSLTNGTFDASSGFDIFINNNWSVNGGSFEPGQGRVRFNGTSGTQSISGGTMWDILFEGAAIKSIDGNISAEDDIVFASGTGNVEGNDRTIFIGGDWDMQQADAFVSETSTVILNGANQDLEDSGFDLSFHNMIFQNTGTKEFYRNATVSGDFSIISENNFVDLRVGTVVSITGTLSQTGGELRIFDSNFPTAGSYSLTGGEVEFRNDGTQSLPANITFNDVEIRDNGGGATTANLTGNITVVDDLNLDDGDVTLNVNGHTITLGDNLFVGSDEVLSWGSGTLIHTGASWYMDTQFNTTTRGFENLILQGTGVKRPNSDIFVGGNLTISDGIEFEQFTRAVSNDGDGVFTMEQNTILDNRVVGLSVPSGFASYSIDPTSTVQLNAAGNQTLFTQSGTIQYGEIYMNSTGTVTLDGNLIVQGDFDMTSNPTLADAGFNITLNGDYIDIQDYTPSASTTVTFARSGDQIITDNDGNGLNLDLENVVFGGSGTKNIFPNATSEYTNIDGTVTINSGVTVTTSRGVDFSGSSWTNNGEFYSTVGSRPFEFTGTNSTMDPGTHEIEGLIVSNSGGTLTIQNNGLNLGTGVFQIDAGAALDFTGLTHTLETINFTIDPAASWILTGATIDFDRNSAQNIPVIDEANANITGIPSIITSTVGTKTLTGNIVVDNVTIGANTAFDVSSTYNYQITVNGNWDNQGGSFLEREGTVIFNSDNTVAKTINPNGRDFAQLIFQGTAVRTYSLTSDMRVDGNVAGDGLTLASATLDLSGQALTLGDNDTDDPPAEVNVIGNNGTLEIGPGGTLQFSTYDDNGDALAAPETGGILVVQSGGTLNVVGSAADLATITRFNGGNQIDINIEAGGEIGAQYYSIEYLTDEGLEVEDDAIINATNNFSNGSFSNIDTDAGPNTYLSLESDAAMTIDNVTFNFSGTPTVANHFNVSRTNTGGNGIITFTNTSGALGRVGATYENDPGGDRLEWDIPNDTQWLGTTSTEWSNASNWDNGVPSISTNDRSAIIALGAPFNPTINSVTGTVNIRELIIEDGILKLISGGTLDVDGDFSLGDGSGGAFIMDNTSTMNIQGSWNTTANAIFDNGESTVTFDASSGSTVTIFPGDQSFHNLTFTNSTSAGEFNIFSSDLDINGNLTIANSANVIPATSNYDYTVAGNITSTGGNFDTDVNGEIILDGADQTITDAIFDQLTASGTGTKTAAGTLVTINDIFEVESGVTWTGETTLEFNNDVEIYGTFNGVTGQIYNFNGTDWIAVPNSYTGEGTVNFTYIGGTQYIRQVTDGSSNAVEFHNLTLAGTAQIQLGRLIGGKQYDGNIDITGDLTVNNSINRLDVNGYLIDNTSGTGTMTLASGEYIQVEGSDNFPSNFANYDLADDSFTLYYGTVDQSIRGGIEYGHLYLFNPSLKTLGGNIDIDGNLYFQNSTLDVSTNNYSINIANRWDTNNGNDDGSFISRSGTVIFDGDANQVIDLGETGTQAFNDVQVNKGSSSILDVGNSNISITGNLNVFNGTFDINGLTATIGGNIGASGTGQYQGTGTYYLNASTGTPTIGTNGSTIQGSLEINAPGRTYELVDNITLLNNFTLTSGTLDINGQTMSVGNAEDVVNIFGTLNVSTTAKPGGTLALGNDVQLVVQPGGTINIVGTASQPATVTSTGINDYLFSVTGTSSNKGNIAARFYLIEYVGVDGIYINDNTNIDVTNNFSDGTFQNGFAGGKYLRIENDQDLTGSNRIENIVFDDDPGAGASNIYKATASTGDIEVFNYTGIFSGDDYDVDPNDLITWLDPPTVTWTGAVNSDWFTAGNWDSGSVPLATQSVIIPQVLNEPVITDNASIAVADNLTLEVNARLILNTTDNDVDLQIGGDLNFEPSARLESAGSNDDIEIGGSWTRVSTALFTAGTSHITFNSVDGLETLDASDSFYDLTLNLTGTINLLSDLGVTNDFNLTAGTLGFGGFDMTVGNDFVNAGTINVGSNLLSLIPNNTSSPKTFNPGTSEYYNLVIGQLAGNDVTYDLNNDLIVNHDFNLVVGTLNPINQNITFGDSDGFQDDINIGGTILVGPNETMSLGDDAYLLVQNGGDLRFIGSSSNASVMTRRSSGTYDFTVQSGGTFEASNFLFEYMEDEGIWLQSGATLVGLDNGTFGNGSSTQYLRLSNAFASDITATNITFNNGPASNVRRNEAAGNNIIFEDASGVLSGPTYEIDDNDPTTGEVQWSYTNPLRIWTGAVSTRWDDNDNWEDEFGVSPATFPVATNTVQIPDVSAGSNRYPVIDATSGDEAAASITIFTNAQLTVDDGQALTVSEELTNEGTFIIPGTTTPNISVGDSWTNNGTLIPGNSTITLNSDADITVSGGLSFWNLIINGSSPSIEFTTNSLIDVNNDLTVTQGILRVTDAGHTINIGNNLSVDGPNGQFIDQLSTVTFDGNNQNIGSAALSSTLLFNNVILAGTGTKTLEDGIDLEGNLTVNTGVTLDMQDESLSFAGNSFDIDGSLETSTGANSITFDGTVVQVITGSSGAVQFENLVVNNTAIGNNDIQWNIGISVNQNLNFINGVAQSTGSNPLTFNDGSTVSYDGVQDVLTSYIDSDDNSYAVGPVRKIGDGNFIFPTGEGSRFARIAISNIDKGSNTDVYEAEYFFSDNADRTQPWDPNIAILSSLEYWDLENVNGHSGEPFVSLYWSAASNVIEPTELLVAHYNGTSWDDEGNSVNQNNVPEDEGFVTSNNRLSSFSPFTLASVSAAGFPLPVDLVYFKAESLQNEILVSWATASEVDNSHFEVLRSTDGVTFEKIGTVEGNGTTNTTSEYSFTDYSPRSGRSYYKLIQYDLDGDFEAFDPIAINRQLDEDFLTIQLIPNPTTSSNINVNVSSIDKESPVSISLINMQGHTVFQESYDLLENRETINIRTNYQLPFGVYQVKVLQAGQTKYLKLIVR
ncbi:T9SS type A sorting domain-containing protein [Reichenbachiella versicolor]|uniref:T9SS type A sorting domain-containing protein n=1 Tax=Reichenbachiella versicolor TaxID=1821036 RepID=UPI000D6E4D11|nr:T9SS type A sorting domain-containing protein [Reichenbachiella versicolor]